MKGLGGFNLPYLLVWGVYYQCETLDSLTCFSNFQDNVLMEGNFYYSSFGSGSGSVLIHVVLVIVWFSIVWPLIVELEIVELEIVEFSITELLRIFDSSVILDLDTVDFLTDESSKVEWLSVESVAVEFSIIRVSTLEFTTFE